MNIFDIKIRDWTREEEKYIDEDGVSYNISSTSGPFTKRLLALMKQVMIRSSGTNSENKDEPK